MAGDGIEEQGFAAGNLSGAVRRGDTVERAAGEWTPTVHRLLEHVAAERVGEIPRPLGRTEDGREILSHVDGIVPHYPLPDWVWADAVLLAAAQWLAAFHDATAGFDRAGAIWPLPAHAPDEVICHNDFAPYNLVFDPQSHDLVGAIDFDTASPGPRVWDVAYLAYRIVPLADPTNPDVPTSTVSERRRRLRLLARAYGDALDPGRVASTAVDRLAELAEFTADRRDPRTESHVELYRRDASWITAHRAELA